MTPSPGRLGARGISVSGASACSPPFFATDHGLRTTDFKALIDRRTPHCYSTKMRKGVPISPGVAVARAYCVDELLASREPQQLDSDELSEEVSRFTTACVAAAQELDAIVSRVAAEVGEEEAGIFRAHRLLIRDPALIG